MTTARPALFGTLALLGATAAWGSTFPLIKDAVADMPVSDFLAVRFWLAGLLLLALRPRAIGLLSRADRKASIVVGLLYAGGQLLQTVGLQYTSAAVSGFVTGMYVVFTPLIFAVVLRQRPDRLTWVATAVATAGVGVLSLRGFALGGGEAITLVSAFVYALHIIALSRYSTTANAYGITALSLFVVAAVCSVGAAPEGLDWPSESSTWWSILYTAAIPGALALLLQTWAQAVLPATRAAIIMTTEPLFAAVFAVLLASEAVTSRLLIGGALVLAAMYVVELGPRHSKEAELPHTGPL